MPLSPLTLIYIENTTEVYARIDTELKENAEEILSQLGITPSSAIQMLYSQIVLTKGFSLNLRLPHAKPTAIGGMSRPKLDAELTKCVESLKSDKTYTADEVDAKLAKEVGILAYECLRTFEHYLKEIKAILNEAKSQQ